ncbi:MAG: hypothetical protein V4640_05275 [Verrucomicrobiota bacterium]
MEVDIAFTQVSEDNDLEHIARGFCDEHGDGENGVISDEEYDRLYDLLGAVISKYASYSDDGEDADFMGSRYVDQIPWITLVADDEADPAVATKAALETINSAHRPLAISFDYYPDYLLVMPPNIVYSTFPLTRIKQEG